MSFIILAHSQLQLSPQEVQVIGVKPNEDQYLLFRMVVRFAAAVPDARAGVKSPGEIDIKPLKVFTVEPGKEVSVPRPQQAHLTQIHSKIRVILLEFLKQTFILGYNRHLDWFETGAKRLDQVSVFRTLRFSLFGKHFGPVVRGQTDMIMDDRFIDLLHRNRPVRRPLGDGDYRGYVKNMFLTFLTQFHRYFSAQISDIGVIGAGKNQALVVRMYQGSFKGMKNAGLFNKSIGKIGVEPLHVLAFHPYPGLGIQARRRFLNE
ncbi:hypothetical protein ES703_34006 [subsurface metagenome]